MEDLLDMLWCTGALATVGFHDEVQLDTLQQVGGFKLVADKRNKAYGLFEGPTEVMDSHTLEVSYEYRFSGLVAFDPVHRDYCDGGVVLEPVQGTNAPDGGSVRPLPPL